MKEARMKRLCGWCGCFLGWKYGSATAVTTGICPECDDRVRRESDLPPRQATPQEAT